MIQLNLLPDVKMEYIKAQRTRRLVFSVAVLAASVSLIILLLLLSADGLQKKHMKDLAGDISDETHQLESEPQINKMLTVQNQLASLTGLHAGKPAVSKLFIYLNQVTPKNVYITDFNIDFTGRTATITGTSGSLANVNTYVDTLKHVTFKDGDTVGQPFTNVVLSSFGLNTDSPTPGQAANYTVTLLYNQSIFDITKNVKFEVPDENLTRPNAGKPVTQPTDLFQAPPPSNKEGQ